MSNLQTFFPYGTLYVAGFNLTWASNTSITISNGLCRDSTNTWFINGANGPFTVFGSFNGVNGLDTGTLGASKWYAVYMIVDQTNKNPPATLLSASFSIPVMPQGYGVFRRIGAVYSNLSTQFSLFFQSGNSNGRFYQWDKVVNVLNAGSSTTFAAVNLITAAPSQSMPVYLTAAYTPASAANTTSIRPTGSAATAGSTPLVIKSPSAAQIILPSLRILPLLSSGNPSIDYVVVSGDALTLNVSGFEDSI